MAALTARDAQHAFTPATMPDDAGMTSSASLEAVSVIIPTYNRARFLPRSIRSALAATADLDEIIVVDDGSTDDTATVVEPYLDRVRYVRIPNGGAGAARNHGVRIATKPLVSFLDSDDEWLPDKLVLQRQFMTANPDVVFCFSDFDFCDDDTGDREPMYLYHWHGLEPGWMNALGSARRYSSLFALPSGRDDFDVYVGDAYPVLLRGLVTAAWTTVIRRELAGDALHFQEGIKICEDWWCYGRLAQLGPAAYFDCATARNHGHGGARVTDANQFEFLSCRIDMTRDVWGRDSAFRQSHGELFDRTMATMHGERAKWLLSRGRTREARADLGVAGASAGALVRILAALPAPVALALGTARRLAMSLVRPRFVASGIVTSVFGATA